MLELGSIAKTHSELAVRTGYRGVASGVTFAMIALTVSGCAGSPTATTSALNVSAPTTLWQLSGTVSTDGGRLLGGARLTIPDGVNAGRYTSSNGDGTYLFSSGLEQDTFTLQITAPGHASAARTVTLTHSVVLNIEIPKMGLGLADLRFGGNVVGVDIGQDGRLGFRATGLNSGDGCAGGIRGTTEFHTTGRSAFVTIPWTLTGVVVSPDRSFEYTGCCVTPEQLRWEYVTLFTNGTVPCNQEALAQNH